MILRQRVIASTIGIIAVTIASIALVRCGCSTVAWVLELGAAVLYVAWILRILLLRR